MKKPSEIFEGENSSLKKTFDSVTTPKEEEIREEFAKNFRTGLGAWHPNYEMVTDYILKIRREAIAERDEEIKDLIKNIEFDSGFETSFNKQYRQGKEDARVEIISHLTQE